jgi:hypothetical protein
MVAPVTAYKQITLPEQNVTSTWGDALNNGIFTDLDSILGKVVTKTLSNANVNLTLAESKCAIVKFIGTLSAAIQITIVGSGVVMVENLTSGAFTVTFGNVATYGGALVGSTITLSQGDRHVVVFDTTNGAREIVQLGTETVRGILALASQAEAVAGTDTAKAVTSAGVAAVIASIPGSPTVIPSGTSMLFVQTAAPTGWTKSTTHNDKALRVVSGTASSGGTSAFSTVFINQGISGNTGSYILATTDIPSHTHTGTSGTESVAHTHTGTSGTESVAHSHSASTGTDSVSHTHSGTTGTESATHTHSYNAPSPVANYAGGGNAIANQTSATTGANSASHTHNITTGNNSASHNHSVSVGNESATHTHTTTTGNPSVTHTHSFTTDATGGGGGHVHSLSGSTVNLAVQYVDVIIAVKN